MNKVIVLKEKYFGREDRFPGKIEVRIGRDPEENDLVLGNIMISGKHARIALDGGISYLEDLESRNGTYLDGDSVRERQIIYPGSIINLAGVYETVFDLEEVSEEESESDRGVRSKEGYSRLRKMLWMFEIKVKKKGDENREDESRNRRSGRRYTRLNKLLKYVGLMGEENIFK